MVSKVRERSSVQSEWARVTAAPKLEAGEAQVWRLNLAASDVPRVIAAACRRLTPRELERSQGIRSQHVREEFIAARGLLRLLLGENASGVDLDEGANGKPFLRGGGNYEFNVSHSHGLILVALSKAGPIGVDVEFIDAAFGASEDLIEIARENFDPAQVARVERAASDRERLLEFYRGWTRKEAVAKADGRGIAESLHLRFDPVETPETISAGQGYRASLEGNKGEQPSEFFVQALAAGEPYAAALATRSIDCVVRLFDAAHLAG